MVAGEHFLQTFFSFPRKPEGSVFANDFSFFFGLLDVVFVVIYFNVTAEKMAVAFAVTAFVSNNPY